jgi:hypothetical protein
LWLPETKTLFAPFTNPNELPWPVWMDIVRLSVLAPVWQVALTTSNHWYSSVPQNRVCTCLGDWTFDKQLPVF